jgi:hypothetical protein
MNTASFLRLLAMLHAPLRRQSPAVCSFWQISGFSRPQNPPNLSANDHARQKFIAVWRTWQGKIAL